jgi:hypothetical protein
MMHFHANSELGTSMATTRADPMMLRLEDCESLQLPPGLDLPIEQIKGWLSSTSLNEDCHAALQAGLPAKVFTDTYDGIESDDTSVGSGMSLESSQCLSVTHDFSDLSMDFPMFIPVTVGDTSDSSNTKQLSQRSVSPKSEGVTTSLSSPRGLVLAEVSQLKASSPSFVPELLSEEVALLVPDANEQEPPRTKLSAKAGLFVPSCRVPAVPLRPLPFVPMAAVIDAWQHWSDKRLAEGLADCQQ